MNHCVGNIAHSKTLRLPLGFDYRRKRTDRKAFVPVVILKDGTIGKVDYHGSAHIHSYIHADGFMAVELGVQEILKGSFFSEDMGLYFPVQTIPFELDSLMSPLNKWATAFPFNVSVRSVSLMNIEKLFA